jgi:hypothetical protein
MPFIHLNGTSAEALIEERCTAHFALMAAFDALKRIAPNGRDYYPYGDPAKMERATAQHRARLQRVQDIIDELEAEVAHIESVS